MLIFLAFFSESMLIPGFIIIRESRVDRTKKWAKIVDPPPYMLQPLEKDRHFLATDFFCTTQAKGFFNALCFYFFENTRTRVLIISGKDTKWTTYEDTI